MGLLDKLKQAWSDTTAEAADQATRTATRAAAQQTVGKAKEALETAGNEILDEAEARLAAEEALRKDRTDWRPRSAETAPVDELLRKTRETEAHAKAATKGTATGPSPEEKARAELARLKAARDGKTSGSG